MKRTHVLCSLAALALSPFAAVACGESGSDDDGSSSVGVGAGASGSNTGSSTATASGTDAAGSSPTGGDTTTTTTETGGGAAPGGGSCPAPPCTPASTTTGNGGGAGGGSGAGVGNPSGAGGGDTSGAGGGDPSGAGGGDTSGAGGGDTSGAGGAGAGGGDTVEPVDDSTPADDSMPTDDSMPADDDSAEPIAERGEGPCDIYNAAGNECVAAYSTIRALRQDYDGPLYQVRSGSNAMNTGSGGELHDIPQTAAGFADAAVQDDVCAGTICTVSLLYDQSGRGNDLPVAKRGRSEGGEFADDDDFETIADAGPLTVGGNNVYSMYMEARQGYRLPGIGDGMARGTEPQAIYMLADGTHSGSACCWDFGNVVPDASGQWQFMNTLFLGIAYWGRGAGSGPWFMADFEAGVWAGGSNPGEPGWGALDDEAPPNEANPSMRVPFALGFLKTNQNYALRMADLSASEITTAYEGPMPKAMDNQGGIVLGVGGDNSNNSWGTFFEGAIVLGYPADDTELAVMQNIQAVGYGM